ncbi:hypothetical protein PILCRDRAFT_9047 [Piloderma croceum F 1598]|uniref:CxC2-like cysteine cluster KDZ transposase-associated domain-containing protein n=1 Tax=Piloderma croceum (strain F 1598) TaxID=765440 RepID=A0A0C3FP47_PILCF|nr:hypothetical protein PILCRDRAFT_9047 [Piloderma croceum F 1598]
MSKRKTGRPAINVLYTNHANASQVVDRGYYVSGDGSRITAHAPSPKKRRCVLPENLQDEYAHWIPSEDFNGDQEPAGDGVEEPAAGTGDNVHKVDKRKQYLSSDEPMRVWRDHEWNGNFWEKQMLKDLGLVMQFGHSNGLCLNPGPIIAGMIIEHNGIHPVLRAGLYPASVSDPQSCATFQVLEEFHLLNLTGGLNVHDFIGALERRTDATGVTLTPDHYKAFSRMFRQWTFLKRLKRSGCAHDLNSVKATKEGECAVACWACPHNGINLPPDWRNVEPKFMFLYMLILAMDANFRLSNCIRKNDKADPELGPGWAYLVNNDWYSEHLKNYVSEKDISTCIAFAALFQKDSRMTTGLRSSGVGACMCARHKVIRPCGVGDLQKGERYANMDYIFFSAIVGVTLLAITISYDIVCQWKINLAQRMSLLLKRLTDQNPDLPPIEERLRFSLPVWHANAHERDCQVSNSLRYQQGMAHTDGEGIEHGWSHINGQSSSTKEMGPGARHNTLDDHFGYHNWQWNIGLGNSLKEKLEIAIKERQRQVECFKGIKNTLKTEMVKEFKQQVEAWEADPSQPNPYIAPKKGGLMEAEVRLQLRKDEMDKVRAGKAPLHETSATSFLVAGLQLEEMQGPRAKKKKGTEGESRKILSWIWLAGEVPGEDESGGLHSSIRIEWLKARARKNWWSEEWWSSHEVDWDGLDQAVADGLPAYALRQAALHRALGQSFKAMWDAKKVKAARAAEMDQDIFYE